MHSDNQNNNLVVFTAKEPKSSQAIIDLLKWATDLAINNKLSYVCVDCIIDGEAYSKSISLTCPP